MAVIDGVLEASAPQQRAHELEQCHAALRKTDLAIANLARAIAVAGDLTEVLNKLQAARTQRDQLVTSIAALERAKTERFDRCGIATKVEAHLSTWRTLLATRHVEDGRRLLREVLAGPLRFTPEAV